MKHSIDILLVLGVLFLISIALLDRYTLETTSAGPLIRPALNAKEAYTDYTPLSENYDATNKSYSLLDDVLPLKTTGLGKLNAERCYAGDFQTRIEKTGSFRQLTNNYKRGDPDSCTSPLQEFTTAFYSVESLA